jgi:hypothetical protein
MYIISEKLSKKIHANQCQFTMPKFFQREKAKIHFKPQHTGTELTSIHFQIHRQGKASHRTPERD